MGKSLFQGQLPALSKCECPTCDNRGLNVKFKLGRIEICLFQQLRGVNFTNILQVAFFRAKLL